MIDAYIRRDDDPVKWKKHLVLVDSGLREMTDLAQSIHRFSASNINEFTEHILASVKADAEEYCYIVKLVYKKEFHKLPNIVFMSSDSTDSIRERLMSLDMSQYAEVWYCKNAVSGQGKVFGRLMISGDELFPAVSPQLIELVWAGSARKIESFPMQDCPYVRLFKKTWNAEYAVETFVPHGHDSTLMQEDIDSINAWLASYYHKIKDFARDVFSCGCSSISIEFSYGGGSFSFIDWDSDNDIKVIF